MPKDIDCVYPGPALRTDAGIDTTRGAPWGAPLVVSIPASAARAGPGYTQSMSFSIGCVYFFWFSQIYTNGIV